MKSKIWRLVAVCCLMMGLAAGVLHCSASDSGAAQVSVQRTTGFADLGHGLVQRVIGSRLIP